MNALLPIHVTLFGMLIDVIAVKLLKALSAILVTGNSPTVAGIFICTALALPRETANAVLSFIGEKVKSVVPSC